MTLPGAGFAPERLSTPADLPNPSQQRVARQVVAGNMSDWCDEIGSTARLAGRVSRSARVQSSSGFFADRETLPVFRVPMAPEDRREGSLVA